MGAQVSRSDFEWSYTEEPHATRRKEIIKKHPEVKKLMGHDPNLKWVVSGMVLFQIISSFFVKDFHWFPFFMMAYCIGGVLNHSLTLAIHEISHNLAFGHSRPLLNRALGMFANLPLGIPMSVSFKKYHLEHHKYQGDEEYDMDLPSRLEARFFHNSFTKFLWLLLQPFFYALRPLFLRPKPLTLLEAINTTVQILFDVAIVHFFGWRSLMYLTCSSFLAMGLHPVAGHFISEHYVFVKGYETYSYYGPLNWITFNVGYHNEHHDFPNVPGSRLPEVKKIAPEYYDNLPCHTSWSRVLYDFIFDPAIGPYARIKRKRIERTAEENGNTVGKDRTD